jgi:pilus assembly protein CpaE
MGKKTHVVIIDLDKKSSKSMENMLKKVSTVETKSENHDLSKGLELVKKSQPDLVILNLYPSEELTLGLARKIGQRCPEAILIVTSEKTDSELVISSMRAGAREFISQPLVEEEFILAVNRVIKTKRQAQAEKGKEGKVMTLFGVKGGVGTTTIISNIATVLAMKGNIEVIVLDLNFQFGNASVFLDIKTKYSILEIATNIDNIDIPLLKSKLPKNSAGVTLMSGPPKIEEAEAITAKHIEDLIDFFRTIFDYIIIDTNHVFDDVTLKALDESDTILLVSRLDVPTIYNTRRCLDVFQCIGYEKDKVKLILNRYTTSSDVDMTAMEKLIENPIFWRLPESQSKTIDNSINMGVPIVEMVPNSKLSQSYIKMVGSINGVYTVDTGGHEQAKEKNGSFFKKKRK